jgi:hypothetical protein
MKKILTLNEEINRMKSLFNNSRVHGNLNESNLLTEQGVGKKLMKALSNVAVVLKGFDPKLLTNFLETEIRNYDDLSRHLNQYDSLWRKIIPLTKDFDYVKDMASELSRIQSKNTLNQLDEKLMKDILKGIPEEGGLREAFLDMWLESQGKSIKNVPDNTQRVVVKDGKTGENVLHVKDEGGNIKTYREEGGEMKEVYDYDGKKAEEDFVSGGDNVSTSNISDSDVTSNVKSTSEPINPKGNPDVTQGQMIELIEKAMELLAKKGETPKPITNKGLEEGITNGGTLVVKGQDGKYYTVEKVDNTIVTIDGDGNIIDIKELGTTNTTPKPDPIETGNNKYGDNKIPPTDTKNMDKSLLGVLRYLFPVTSTGVKFVRWVGGKTSLLPPGFTKDRFTWFPKSSDAGTSNWRAGARFAESVTRVFVIEQMFFAYFYGSYKEYQRGEEKPFAVDTFWTKKVPAYVFLLKDTVVDGLVGVIDDIIKYFSSAEADNEWCKNYCETEEGIDPSKVTESPCFKKCTTKIEETKKTFEELKKEVEDYSNTLKEIGKLEDMDESEIEKFCSGADGKKLKLTNSLTKMKKGILTFEESVEKQKEDNQVVGFLVEYAGLGEDSTMDDVLDKVLTPPGEKERISVSQLEDLQKQVDQRCIDWYNKDQGGEIPINNDGPVNDVDDSGVDGEGKSTEEKSDMVYLNMSIIPIEIIGDDEA